MVVSTGENSDVSVTKIAISLEPRVEWGCPNRDNLKPVGFDATFDPTGIWITRFEAGGNDFFIDAFGEDTWFRNLFDE